MLSTKFKVSFVKLSLEISRGLKDILHTVVTSNFIIISHVKSLVLKDKDSMWVRVRVCIEARREGGSSFLEMHFFGFFTPVRCTCRLTSNSIK